MDDNTLNPDMFVSTTENIASPRCAFSRPACSELESVPGVAEMQRSVRRGRMFHGSPVMLLATELAKLGRRVKRHMIAGDEETMNRLAPQEKGVILSENLAALVKLRLGRHVELPTPTGMLRLPVVGIIRDSQIRWAPSSSSVSLYMPLFPGRHGGRVPRLSDSLALRRKKCAAAFSNASAGSVICS